jgi:predicted Zn-dependent peptidase
MKDKQRSAIKIIELALGMGGSGRLYQRLRADLGLVYTINVVSSLYEDTGFLGVRAVCEPEQLTSVQDAVLDEWLALCEDGLNPDELAAAKGNYAGTLARRFETNLAVAGIYGLETLLHEVEPFDKAVARIEGVSAAQVIEAARQFLNEDGYVLTTLGPSPS